MMRYFLVVFLMLAVISPVWAQDDDQPLYIECGAETFMLDRSEDIKPADDLVDEFNNATSDSDQMDALGDLYVVYSEIRDVWMSQQAVPDCVDALRQLDLQWMNAMMDYIAMVFIADSSGNQYYTVLAQKKRDRSKEIAEEIETLLSDLDWVGETGEIITDSPPYLNRG